MKGQDTDLEGEIRHCPLCGSEISPYHSVEARGRARAAVECPEHGDLEVIYEEQ